MPLSALDTLTSRLAGSLAMPTIAAGMLGTFSLLALLLASLGIYGVVSFAVARRSPEMGIRIALGAEPLQLINMVMREMLATVTIGLAIGIGLAMLAAPALTPVLYQVSPFDMVSFAIGALLLVAVATLATFLRPGARPVWTRWWRYAHGSLAQSAPTGGGATRTVVSRRAPRPGVSRHTDIFMPPGRGLPSGCASRRSCVSPAPWRGLAWRGRRAECRTR